MSNSQQIVVSSADLKKLKEKYLELILQGYVENAALQKANFPKHIYLKLLLNDDDFVKNLNEARKLRADVWVSKIVQDIDVKYTKDEIPNQRLKFDKLQFLAKADNPEKYGSNTKKVDINIDLSQFRLLPTDAAMKALSEDPFAPQVIEVEFTDIEDEDLL